jgi:DNA transformation protein
MADESFKEFVLDQLGPLPELRAKAMFGGYGLYQADRFFAILMDGRLYCRTDEQTRAAYVERGMGPFTYEKARRTMTINYFEVPPEVLENREQLAAWANHAIHAAAARHRSPTKRAKPPSQPPNLRKARAL